MYAFWERVKTVGFFAVFITVVTIFAYFAGTVIGAVFLVARATWNFIFDGPIGSFFGGIFSAIESSAVLTGITVTLFCAAIIALFKANGR